MPPNSRACATHTAGTVSHSPNSSPWLDGAAPTGAMTEIDVVEQLEAFRREDDTLVDVSFDTISGAGANGAIIHYRVSEASNRTLVPGELMLVDSGGQYLNGTTDITPHHGDGAGHGRAEGPLHPRPQGHDRSFAAEIPGRHHRRPD